MRPLKTAPIGAGEMRSSRSREIPTNPEIKLRRQALKTARIPIVRVRAREEARAIMTRNRPNGRALLHSNRTREASKRTQETDAEEIAARGRLAKTRMAAEMNSRS